MIKNSLPNPEKYSQGYYTPQNPQKYRGKMPIRCLSSWEFKVCAMFDLNPSITFWSSESIQVRYVHPIKSAQLGRQVISTYYPDFAIEYVDKFGKRHREIIEVKPKRQAFMEAAKTNKEKLDAILNKAKWDATRAIAKQYGYSFRVLTEDQIYGGRK